MENVIRDQAISLIRQDHEVLVLAGSGQDPREGYAFAAIPELSYDFPLHEQTRKVLETGQYDQNFNKYRAAIVEALRPALAQTELTIVHNVFTMHFNLALTQALHELSKEFPMVAWTHDLTATNTDYALPNPRKMPWSLVNTAPPGVPYVAVSDARFDQIKQHVTPTPPITVIPDVIDQGRLFNLTPEMNESLEALALDERDYIFFTPSRVMVRKNIDFAIEIVRTIQSKGSNPLLLISAAPEINSTAAAEYGKFLRFSLPETLRHHVVFVHDHFPVTDRTIHDLYSLSDCLLFPSRQEGFGLPVIEAALHRLPIWCNNVPAVQSIGGEGAFIINKLSQLNDALVWLEAQDNFRLHRRVRKNFDPRVIYKQHYAPFFKSLNLPQASST